MEERRVVRWGEGTVACGLWSSCAAAGKRICRLQAARPVHQGFHRSSQGMDRGVQDGWPDDLSVRLFRAIDGGRAAGQRRLPCGEEAGVGLEAVEGDELRRSQPV